MSQQDNSSSGLIELGMWICIVSGLTFGLWWLMRPYVMWISFYTSFYVFKYAYAHLSFLMTDSEYHILTRSIKAIPTINPTRMGIEALYRLFEIHGYVLRWPTAALMVYMGWATRKGIVRFKYRRQIKTVYDLIDIQAKHFPASKIIQGKNLLDMHPYEGPWRTYALPIDFALDEQLLWTLGGKERTRLDPLKAVDEKAMVPIPPFSSNEKLEEFSYKRKKLPHYRYTAFNLARANEVFSKQLGPLWAGSDALPPMERGLYAAFCAQAAGDAGEAAKLINQMAFSWVEASYDKQWNPITPHHCDISGAEDLIEQYEQHVEVQKVIRTHAHTYNVLYGVLHAARSNGRLYHANFLWLRPVNPLLFFHLTSDGGQCGYFEDAGLWAHYQTEELMGKKILKPMVFSAVYALHDELSKEHWIDPGEYSEDAQRRVVESANKTLKDAAEAAAGAVTSTGFTTTKTQTKRASATTGVHNRGDNGDDVP